MQRPNILLAAASAVGMLLAGAAFAAGDVKTPTGATPSQLGADASGQRSQQGEGLLPGGDPKATITGNAAGQPTAGAEPGYQSYVQERGAFSGRIGGQMAPQEVLGAQVVTADGAPVGRITDLLIGQNGDINHVIVDAGTYAGTTKHNVVLDMDLLAPEQGSGQALVVNMREDQLRALPPVEMQGSIWRHGKTTP